MTNLSVFLMIICGIGTVISDDGDCQECGQQNQMEILNGEVAYGYYPMMAALLDTEKRRVVCAATIVNRRQLLTAARCFRGHDVNSLAVITDEDTIRTNGYDNETSTRTYRISSATKHKYFTHFGDLAADIAMVTIDGAFQYSKALRPACLPFKLSPDSLEDKEVVIVYWIPKSQSLVTIGKKVEGVWGHHARISTCPTFQRQHLCTTDDSKEFCDRHPGAPVFWREPTTKALVLVGIYSYTSKCGLPSTMMHTRVSTFMDWIQKVSVPDANYCRKY